jgi:hypothetical protein
LSVHQHGYKQPLCRSILFAFALQATSSGQLVSTDSQWRSSQHASEARRAAQWAAYHAEEASRQPHRFEFAMLASQWKTYEAQQLQWAGYYRHLEGLAAASRRDANTSVATLPPITMRGRCAYGLRTLPPVMHRLIEAANSLQNKPYLLGGGHKSLEDVGYDCSSATSYVLIKAGLLMEVLNSARFVEYGEPGPGRHVTLWVKPGHHVFLTICGLRLDTSGGKLGEGPRWRTAERCVSGFTPRHPTGL